MFGWSFCAVWMRDNFALVGLFCLGNCDIWSLAARILSVCSVGLAIWDIGVRLCALAGICRLNKGRRTGFGRSVT